VFVGEDIAEIVHRRDKENAREGQRQYKVFFLSQGTNYFLFFSFNILILPWLFFSLKSTVNPQPFFVVL